MDRTEETSRPVRRGFISEGGTWRGEPLYTSAWRRNQPPELNETVPAARLGRDRVSPARGIAP